MKRFYNFVTSPNETELFLNGAIISGSEKYDETDVIFNDFKNTLDLMADNTTLKLHISSPGGEVMATQNIMCLLANAKSQKNITIESYISLGASCASWLPTISDKIYVYENNSMIMMHLPYTMMIANRIEIEKEQELLTKIENQMIGNYMSKVREGITEDKIRSMLEAETWLTGEEFVDIFDAELIPTTSKMVACADIDILNKYKNVPKELKNMLNKEGDLVSKTVKNELSQEDIRSELRKQLVDKLGVDKYDIWISGSMVYDSYFIYELWNVMSEEYEYYKATFTRQGDVITVDVDNLEKVERKTIWVTVDEMNTIINQKDEAMKILNGEKEELVGKLNEASDKVVNLNEKIGELQPIVDKYNNVLAEQQELENKKLLNEKREYYKNKFENLGVKSKFESEEVQTLINNCVSDKEALSKLNLMLVDMIKVDSEPKPQLRAEQISKIENLIEVDDVTSKYGFK
jgi:ATP-dependent Clp protease, protease subunit